MVKRIQLPRLGIIGGAGPIAGATLFGKIISICQQKHRCKWDDDFPYVQLISFPFANVLTHPQKHRELAQNQLRECFDSMIANRVTMAVLACNTLHAYLPKIPPQLLFFHLIEETGRYLKLEQRGAPMVLCTSTSAKAKIHQQFFPCNYPDAATQKKVDRVIQNTLKGDYVSAAEELNTLYRDQTVLLGCTELSLLHEREPLMHAQVCDPQTIIAEKICYTLFKGSR